MADVEETNGEEEIEFDTASEQLEAMISMAEGTYEAPDDNSNEDEDTDQSEELDETEEEEIDTNDQIDGDGEDTDGSSDESDESEVEENALVDDGDDEVSSEAEGEESPVADNTAEVAKDADPKAGEEVIDYQKAYEELQEKSAIANTFYDRVTGEFQANGKTVRGSKDPEKVVQGLQKQYGFEDKMKVFKQHKPMLRALQEQGMVEDSTKFDLAMNIASGDKEAFKQHAKNQGWDLMDMDMDEVAYEGKSQTSSAMEMALDDVLESAARGGVQDRMEGVLGKDWDSDSVVKLLDRPKDSAVLISHMENGIYDAVQERIAEKSRSDVHGEFERENNYNQYMIASRELESEYQEHIARESESKPAAVAARVDAGVVADETAKIENARKDERYKADVAKREKDATEARAKAARMSKPKNKTRKVKKEVDKMKLTGDAFSDYFNREILGM